MRIKAAVGLFVILLISVGNVTAFDLHQSVFDQNLVQARYNLMSGADELDDEVTGGDNETMTTEEHANWETKGLEYKQKSPTKAFLLSLVVPGAGQLYYGSKIKAGAFLGAEVVTLFLYNKWDGDAKDMERAFEAYNRDHWSRDDYYDYLNRAFGDTSSAANNFTHTLPSTNTQQYYEMTGKYDQFSWGWDDAELGGLTLDDISGPEYRLDDTGVVAPNSDHRELYEQMRADANDKYDQSTRVLFVTMINHLFAAFEAFITTKKHNEAGRRAENEFSMLQVRAKLLSSYTRYDTAGLTLSYNF